MRLREKVSTLEREKKELQNEIKFLQIRMKKFGLSADEKFLTPKELERDKQKLILARKKVLPRYSKQTRAIVIHILHRENIVRFSQLVEIFEYNKPCFVWGVGKTTMKCVEEIIEKGKNEKASSRN
ncbi:MAG: hypothetical protein ABH800_00360 [Candidatus Nealsonbacteria bacterium]